MFVAFLLQLRAANITMSVEMCRMNLFSRSLARSFPVAETSESLCGRCKNWNNCMSLSCS